MTKKPTAEEDDALGATVEANSQGDDQSDVASGDTLALKGPRGPGADIDESDYEALRPVVPDHYVPQGEIARGGMGRISRARDRRLGREVAIEDLLGGGDERVLRFEREVFITARLQHPSIVNVHEAGLWPDGVPFYAMKLVAGSSLAELLAPGLAPDQRLALLPNLIAIANALAYAHGEGIIHRDLKPDNVLVGEFGETVVIDWGLAKRIDDDTEDGPSTGSADPALTMAGSVVGTPAYMPPEQARGKRVDARADVYSLGAILYHVFAGQRPFGGASVEAILDQVIDSEPRPLRELAPHLPDDLLAIVAKAMQRRPSDRYPTAKELAEDLIRFRRGKLVAAHSYSSGQLLRRWLSRHRAEVTVGAIALVALVAAGVVGVTRVLAERDRAAAEGALAAARANELSLVQAKSNLDSDARQSLSLIADLPLSASPDLWRRARLVAAEANLRGIPGQFEHDAQLAGFRFSATGDLIALDVEGRLYRWSRTTHQRELLGEAGPPIVHPAVSDDDTRLATVSEGNKLTVWNLGDGSHTTTEIGGGMVFDVEWIGNRIAMATSDRRIAVFDPATANTESAPELDSAASDLRAARDGSLLVANNWNKLLVWEPGKAPRSIPAPAGGGTRGASLSGDGTVVATIAGDRAVVLRVADGSEVTLSSEAAGTEAVRMSRDGRYLATQGKTGAIYLWDLTADPCIHAGGPCSVKPAASLFGHSERVRLLAFSDDGEWLASVGDDRTLRMWEIGKHTPGRVLARNLVRPSGLRFSPDGSTIALAVGTSVRTWPTERRHVVHRGDTGVRSVAVSPDGTRIAASDGEVLWVSNIDGTGRRQLGDAVLAADLEFSGAGDRLFVHAVQGSVWDLVTGTRLDLPGQLLNRAAVAPNGKIAAAPSASAIRLWDLRSGESRMLSNAEGYVSVVTYSADGGQLAAGGLDRTIYIWDAVAGGQPRTLKAHAETIRHVAFDRTGTFLVSADASGAIIRWNLQSGAHNTIRAAVPALVELDVAPGGQRVLWISEGRPHLWSSGQQSRLGSPDDPPTKRLALTSDGRAVLAWGEGRDVELWDIASQTRTLLRGHTGEVTAARWSRDGKMIITSSADGTIRVWPYALPHAPAELKQWARAAIR